MDDCKEIDAALNRLGGKIDELNRKLNNVEQKQKECCDKKNDPKDNSLEALLKRIAAIEKYINQLDGEIQLVTNKVKEIGEFFKEMLETLDKFFGKIANSLILFTKLFNYFK